MEAVTSGENTSLPEFLDFLYGGLQGYVSTATKSKADDKVVFSRQSFSWPSERDKLTEWITTNGKTVDVYIAPAIFSEPTGRKEHVLASNVVWTEFDGRLPTKEELGTIPLPTLRLRSSTIANEHWYWKLDAPIKDVALLERTNRALAYQLGADTSGWDAGQVLRPPGTYNHKNAQLSYVSIVSRTDNTVAPIAFDVLPAYDLVVNEEDLDFNTVPDVQELIFTKEWPVETRELFLTRDVQHGDRSTLLMRLGYELAELGFSDAEMFSVLRNADDRWGKFKDRSDRNKQLVNLISKARAKYPYEIELGEDTVPLFGVQSFLDTEIEISWVIKNLLQEQGYMLLTGPAGTGKTQFSLRVAISLALGRDFLGMEITRPHRVLFWSLEMGHSDLKYFVSTMVQNLTDEDLLVLEKNLILAPVGEAFYLDNAKGQEAFKNIISSIPNLDTVFIDSMGSCTSGALSDETSVKALMDFNDNLRNSMGIATWYIHHNRKAQGENKKPNKLSDVYGNVYIVNRATSVYCLWPDGSGIQVIPLKKRLSAMEKPWTITRTPDLNFTKGTQVSILKTNEDDGPFKSNVIGLDLT